MKHESVQVLASNVWHHDRLVRFDDGRDADIEDLAAALACGVE